jgi:hypothetical protein
VSRLVFYPDGPPTVRPRAQFNRGTEEHRAQIENLKQQSTYFLTRRAEELEEVKKQLEATKATHVTEKDTLLVGGFPDLMNE